MWRHCKLPPTACQTDVCMLLSEEENAKSNSQRVWNKWKHNEGIYALEYSMVIKCYINSSHGDVIEWKHFLRYWPFVRGIHRSPVDSPHKGQWRGALIFWCRLIIQTDADVSIHDDVIKWKHFPRNWPFVRGIHRSSVNSHHKGQWRGALIFWCRLIIQTDADVTIRSNFLFMLFIRDSLHHSKSASVGIIIYFP